jgi:CubicO group peptidase (beta-lactamase class C family)
LRVGVGVLLAAVACSENREQEPRDPAPSAAPPMRYAPPSPPPPPDPARLEKARALTPELDALFADDLAKHDYPGLGVAIVLDGEPVYVKGFGFRDLSTKAPFDADTVFPIASVSKSFGAMAVLKLRDEGRLSLDAPAATYYPALADLAYPTRDSPPVTLRQLLGHGSGLPEDNYWVDVQIDLSDADLLGVLRSGASFSRAPDTHFEYSNLGFGIVSKVIGEVAGAPARAYITREILAPLGMTASVWTLAEARPHLAVGYWGADGYRGLDKQKLPAPIKEPGVLDIAGGLYSTLHDMSRYLAYHLSAWPPRDDAEAGPVRRSTLREMHQATRHGDWADVSLIDRERIPVAQVTDTTVRLTTFSYGNGFFTRTTCADDFLVEHSGGLPGYSTYLSFLPEQGFGIVVFINDSRVESRADRAAMALFRKAGLLDRRPVTPAPALSAAQKSIDRLLHAWDNEEAKQLFEPTFFVYQPVERLGEEFAKLAAAHGACQPAAALTAPNRLRGAWRVTCERGAIRFAAALSPNGEPRVQRLDWASELPPSPRMTAAAATLLRLTARWDARAAAALLAEPHDRDALARLALDGGACKLGAPLDGDGTTTATFALTCPKTPMELDITLDDRGRIATWHARRARDPAAPLCAR